MQERIRTAKPKSRPATGKSAALKLDPVDYAVISQALIASAPDVYFTISHFDGFPAVLVLLDHISLDELDELIVDAWLTCAPAKVAKAFFG